MLTTIGNTPIVQLKKIPSPHSADIWVKIEGGNPTGSYKDRMALAMIEGVEKYADFDPSISFLECTGGSTGSSLAFVCAVKGYKFTVITSDAYAREKIDSMRAFGATVLIEPSHDGVVTPDLWPRMRARANKLATDSGYYYLDQFHNAHAPIGYERMGKEIVAQIQGDIDAVCGAVGTAGMIMGVGSVVKTHYPKVQIVALEPNTSAVLSGGKPGSHTIDGTGAGFVPPNFSREVVTDVMALSEQEARGMARRLAQEEGIFAGTSTGLNIIGALRLAEQIGKGGTVVTVACDSGFKYLDGSLYQK